MASQPLTMARRASSSLATHIENLHNLQRGVPFNEETPFPSEFVPVEIDPERNPVMLEAVRFHASPPP